MLDVAVFETVCDVVAIEQGLGGLAGLGLGELAQAVTGIVGEFSFGRGRCFLAQETGVAVSVILGGGVVGIGSGDESVGLVVAIGRGKTGDGLRGAVTGLTGVGIRTWKTVAGSVLAAEGIGEARAGNSGLCKASGGESGVGIVGEVSIYGAVEFLVGEDVAMHSLR